MGSRRTRWWRRSGRWTVSDAPEYSIQISDRGGLILVSGPDANWVKDRAQWARNQLSPAGGTSVGFGLESGASATLERAEQLELPWWLGTGGPSV